MKAGTRSVVIVSPLKTPIAMPTSSPASTPASTPCPCTSTSAQTTPDRPTTEPTERSMPAVRITNVIPAARIAVNAFWRSTFDRFSAVKNASVVNARIRHSRPSATKIAYREIQRRSRFMRPAP